jgi:protein-S-isoprenylcysteine O-methyltransferase Ste14
MSNLAIACYALFLLLGVALRMLIQRRLTGSSGFAGIRARPFSLAWAGNMLFVAGLVMGALAPPLASAGIHPPLAVLDQPPVAWAGFSIFAVALSLMLWAQLAMGASWRIGVDPAARTALVVDGPFRLVRNPIFSTMLLALAGLTLMVPSPLQIGAWLALIVGIELQVRHVEEPYLARTHGEAYLRYVRRTGRFVPGLGHRISAPPIA